MLNEPMTNEPVRRLIPTLMLCLTIGLALTGHAPAEEPIADQPAAGEKTSEEPLLSQPRLLTFEGRRSGEGYFDSTGKRMVFQSERDPANPFYQIYLNDFETGDLTRVSPGFGKTTCAWIHPSGERVLFASTHEDPNARQEQIDELELRATGQQRRYAWDYDPTFELYVAELDSIADGSTAGLTRLTDAMGYDAEASYSPDGTRIVFASNRAAYEQELPPRLREQFELDPSLMIDLYIMDADGTDVRRLTNEIGYDGGPFFSADGKKICWRRFTPDGATAEIYTMNVDGTDVRRLTELGAMSWAPFFHPSGDYLVFTTNRHGFGNFELYLVRTDGQGDLVRVTHTDHFDGLPVFVMTGEDPSDAKLSWTSNRVLDFDGSIKMDGDGVAKGTSQIYIADFDDAAARRLLGLNSGQPADEADTEDAIVARANASATDAGFTPADASRHVDYLTRPELGGRMTGTPGEIRATNYVAAYLESLGFLPAGENGTFFDSFDFPAGSSLGLGNSLTIAWAGDAASADPPTSLSAPELGTTWTPLSFSNVGSVKPSDVVFAGYGLQVPGDDEFDEVDNYVHLNVVDQWVMVLRDLPQDITPKQRQRLARYGAPRRKASIARDLGARGIIFVAGPTSQVGRELIRFDSDASQAQVSLAAISIDNATASAMFAATGHDLAATQKELDSGEPAMGFALSGLQIAAEIDVIRKTGTGRNVIARLPVEADSPEPTFPFVMVGAHVDHLGTGGSSNSLARADEEGQIHVGADDNASGVAAMLEIAQSIANGRRTGELKMKRDLVVAAWSGEELGLFGSQAFVDQFADLFPTAPVPAVDPDVVAIAQAHGMTTDAVPLTDSIAVYLNLDMVGRLDEKLIIQGIGSSPGFAGEVQRRNVPVGLPLQLDKTSTRLPTDASALVARDVPILSAFTGAHEDYHTPRDTPEKLDYDGLAKIGRLFGLLTRGFLTSAKPPEFKLDEGPQSNDDVPRARLTAYLGTIPDYGSGDVKGLKLSGVAGDGPADNAGVRGGDVIIELAGRKIEDIYDYTYAIEALKIGETVDIVVKRDGQDVRLSVTPGSRD